MSLYAELEFIYMIHVIFSHQINIPVKIIPFIQYELLHNVNFIYNMPKVNLYRGKVPLKLTEILQLELFKKKKKQKTMFD